MEKYIFGNLDSNLLIIELIDDHDLELLEKQYSIIKDNINQDFSLCACKVNDWNNDLSPWIAKPVFGNNSFGNNASNTLKEILNDISPYKDDKTIILAGYSLAGLFSLWAGYNSDIFDGIVAASPSVWFENFLQYAMQIAMQSKNIYLSLGDKEEKAKNPILAKVGDNIRELYNHYKANNLNVILEWNNGNHFVDAEKRLAKGIIWMINSLYN